MTDKYQDMYLATMMGCSSPVLRNEVRAVEEHAKKNINSLKNMFCLVMGKWAMMRDCCENYKN